MAEGKASKFKVENIKECRQRTKKQPWKTRKNCQGHQRKGTFKGEYISTRSITTERSAPLKWSFKFCD